MIPFPFNENRFSFFVANHQLVGQLCTYPKSDRSLLSCLKVTQCSTSEIGDAPLYNSCSLPIQVMTARTIAGLPRITVTCFRRSATTLYPSLTSPPPPRPEPAGLLCLVIRREHQHDLPQHQSQPDYRYPPSIRRAPATLVEKACSPVADPYWGGDWGWRRLHWIDVSSTNIIKLPELIFSIKVLK